VGTQTDGLEDIKKRASQDVRGIRSDNHHDSLTILDNVLIVGDSAGGDKRAGGLTLTQETS
jgi:hypothetical protein